MFRLALLASALVATSAAATPPLMGPPPPAAPPRLLVVLTVDQLSADLFEQYRGSFTGGLARLAGGVTFRNGYQAHASTETCPGHSVVLTGRHPAHSGIIANAWIDQSLGREDKTVNCAEDESVAGSSSRAYTASPVHLRVPTLAAQLKTSIPAAKVVSVGGKDRSAIMLSGRAADQRWFWSTAEHRFASDLSARPVPASVTAANTAVQRMIAAPQPGLVPPPLCQSRAIPVQAGDFSVGTGNFARPADDPRAFRNSPAFDGATLALAAALAVEMGLGRDTAPDLLTIGLAGTDIIGHAYGNGGQEMCLQLLSLDRDLGDFFELLDRSNIDYAVAMTSDHGSMDLPERLRQRGVPQATRADPQLRASEVGRRVAQQLGLQGAVLLGSETSGDMWIDRSLPAAERSRALAAAVAAYRAHPQVAGVFTAEELARTPIPTGDPDDWTLQQRARASFFAPRSGDFYVALKPYVSPAPEPERGYVSGHGTPWDYDRRVPILFWRRGISSADRHEAVATVDIMPTLAAMLGLSPTPNIDGKCLQGVQGIACPVR